MKKAIILTAIAYRHKPGSKRVRWPEYVNIQCIQMCGAKTTGKKKRHKTKNLRMYVREEK
jgi:hypothetical protein